MKIFLLALLSLIAVLVKYNIILALFLTILFIVLLILNRQYINAKSITLFVVVFLAFFIRNTYIQNNNYSILANTKDQYEIEIVDNIAINGDFLRTVGYINNEKVIINYKINSDIEKKYFQNVFLGGTLYVDATIADIKDKKNYYSFDSKEYNKYQGIFKLCTIDEIKTIQDKKYNSIYRKIQSLRLIFINYIEKNIKFNKSGYFEALIYGDKGNMAEEYLESYRLLGISHLLAISGLHIATLVALFYKVFRYFKISDTKINFLIFIILPIYTIFTGLQPSTLRASLMIILYIIFRRKISSLSALLLTFLTLLLINPFYIFNIGFQYSFLVTFCLIMSSSYINNSNNSIIKLLKISFISFIAGIPISLTNFYTISFITIISNIVFVPYFTLIIFPLILISYLIFLIDINLFNYISVPMLNIVFNINDFFEKLFLNFANFIYIGKQENLIIYLLTSLIFFLLIFLNKENYKLAGFTLISMLIVIFSAKFYPKDKFEELSISNKQVYFLRKDNISYLINTSNNFQDYYKDFRKKDRTYDIMKEYDSIFKYEGIYSIDYLIITKKSSKEIGYAHNLIGANKIKNVIVLKSLKDENIIKDILNLAKFKNINVIFWDEGSYKINNIVINVNNSKAILNYNNKKYEIS